MKKIDLGQTIGILANLGVLIGILLLAYELNQNRLMTAAQTRSAIADTAIALHIARANTPGISETFIRATAGDEVEPAEMARLQQLIVAEFRNWENQHYQFRIGLYDENEYEANRRAWREVLCAKVYRDIWCGRRNRHSDPFVAEIDELLGESGCD